MDKLFLSVKEMALKLHVSDKTVYRMINDNRIPYGIKIGGQWRFNAEKIEKWIQSNNAQHSTVNQKLTLTKAIEDSAILYKIHGNNRDETLDQILTVYNQFESENIANIKKNILFKESIISSTINGIALMMVDYDEHIPVEKTHFIVAYLDHPIDFKAVDDIPAQIVMLTVPANKTEQLILATRLRGLFMNKKFIDDLKKEPNRKDLQQLFNRVENQLFLSKESHS